MYATVYMTKSCFSGALSAIVSEGSLTLSQTTTIQGVFYIVYAPLQVLGGLFADKYSPEKMITIGLLGGAAANTVIFFTQNYYVMLVVWAFNAIIQFALWPSVFKIISSQLVRSDRKNMAFLISLTSPSGLVLTYLVAACIPETAWRYNFAVSAVVLVLAAVVLKLFCAKLDPILIKDAPKESKTENKKDAFSPKAVKLFAMSGFFFVLPAVLIRTMIETGTKNLSSTMLMQSYGGISPKLGNLLSILIVIGGLAGIFLAKFVIFPRLIKKEITAYVVMAAASAPFIFAISMIGTAPVWLIVLSLAMINLTLSTTHLFGQYYNMYFTKYGKNGTAAGIINGAAAGGMALQYCIFGPVAQELGWKTVTIAWIVMASLMIFFLVLALRPANRFKRDFT